MCYGSTATNTVRKYAYRKGAGPQTMQPFAVSSGGDGTVRRDAGETIAISSVARDYTATRSHRTAYFEQPCLFCSAVLDQHRN